MMFKQLAVLIIVVYGVSGVTQATENSDDASSSTPRFSRKQNMYKSLTKWGTKLKRSKKGRETEKKMSDTGPYRRAWEEIEELALSGKFQSNDKVRTKELMYKMDQYDKGVCKKNISSKRIKEFVSMKPSKKEFTAVDIGEEQGYKMVPVVGKFVPHINLEEDKDTLFVALAKYVKHTKISSDLEPSDAHSLKNYLLETMEEMANLFVPMQTFTMEENVRMEKTFRKRLEENVVDSHTSLNPENMRYNKNYPSNLEKFLNLDNIGHYKIKNDLIWLLNNLIRATKSHILDLINSDHTIQKRRKDILIQMIENEHWKMIHQEDVRDYLWFALNNLLTKYVITDYHVIYDKETRKTELFELFAFWFSKIFNKNVRFVTSEKNDNVFSDESYRQLEDILTYNRSDQNTVWLGVERKSNMSSFHANDDDSAYNSDHEMFLEPEMFYQPTKVTEITFLQRFDTDLKERIYNKESLSISK